jgi:bifunctional NMN adenylyltransferase/nudix hydrolase
MEYQFLVFIGRFQPYHLGHKLVIEEALKLSEKIIILIGSANQPRTTKNPWTHQERARMIFDSFDENISGRIIISPILDYPYDEEAWINQVRSVIKGKSGNATKIGLIGYTKDESSYYLKKFPEWAPHMEAEVSGTINASDIRIAYFKMKFMASAPLYLPPNVIEYLEDFKDTNAYNILVEEQKFLDDHHKEWAFAPYKPTFNTADSVVVYTPKPGKNWILLGKRKNAPGKYLFALPGGYLSGDTYQEAAIRELEEETKIDVPRSTLIQSIKTSQIFDSPNRSLRGRIITMAFLIHLTNTTMPDIEGTDDLYHADWYPFSEFANMEQYMFEDHFAIANTMISHINL